jgi:hypothetical protein
MNENKTKRLAEVRNVSGTAFVVAEFRAEENCEAYPLYRDSVVKLFLNEDTKQAAGYIAAGFPLVKDLVKVLRRCARTANPSRLPASCDPWRRPGHTSS